VSPPPSLNFGFAWPGHHSTLSPIWEHNKKGQLLLTIKKEETTLGCPATMPRGSRTALHLRQRTLPFGIQPCNCTGTAAKLRRTRLQKSQPPGSLAKSVFSSPHTCYRVSSRFSSQWNSLSLTADTTTSTTCCMTVLRKIEIVICWSAVVVHRTKPYITIHNFFNTVLLLKIYQSFEYSLQCCNITSIQQLSQLKLNQCLCTQYMRGA